MWTLVTERRGLIHGRPSLPGFAAPPTSFYGNKGERLPMQRCIHGTPDQILTLTGGWGWSLHRMHLSTPLSLELEAHAGLADSRYLNPT